MKRVGVNPIRYRRVMPLLLGLVVALVNLPLVFCSVKNKVPRNTATSGIGALSPPSRQGDLCYDDSGQGKRCIPDFINAAYGRDIHASSTCGDPPTRHCQSSTESDGSLVLSAKDCFVCSAKVQRDSHPSSYLTDLNNPNNLTCWISRPVSSRDDNVTLTMSLAKKYEVTYVSMQFCSARPDSMAIFKSVDFGRTWIPFQFYSR